MAEFKVWAPLAKQVDVVVDGITFPMRRRERGWWIEEVNAAAAGSDYYFRLDRGETLADPRSRSQPQGVHGPSSVTDPASFNWTDQQFQPRPLSSALVYELHIGTFTPRGTFDSAIEKLPHLAELGVTHVELMPVAEFAGTRGWGYDGVFPYAPHHAYGGPSALARLVDACHAHGLAVILDVVYNHLGPLGNVLHRFGPYFSDRHKTPWGSAINFDGPDSDEVREFFIDNARMWLRDYHFDGLRLDAIHAIVDTSAIPFLEQLCEEVEQLEAHVGRHLVLIAESDLNDPRVVLPRERGGYGFHAQWSDDFHHALHAALTRESHSYYCGFGRIEELATAFRQPFLRAGGYSDFRRRSFGRRAIDLPASSFLAYSQNHDQVGNRATGERLNQLVSRDEAKITAALAILSPYVPMLFQGEEWAASTPFQYFVDFSAEPRLARSVSDGRRVAFVDHHDQEVPDPQSEETFLRSKLNWDELSENEHSEMRSWYRELIRARRSFCDLTDGRLDRVTTRFDEEARWLVVERGATVLAANLGTSGCTIDATALKMPEIALSSMPGVRFVDGAIYLPPHSVALLHAADAERIDCGESVAALPQPISRKSRGHRLQQVSRD